MPWVDGNWYLDPWGGDGANRTAGPGPAVNTKALFSGYKSATAGNNGFRINRGTTYTSSTMTAASVAGGLRIGNISDVNHYLYNLLVFNNRLSTADQTFLELNL